LANKQPFLPYVYISSKIYSQLLTLTFSLNMLYLLATHLTNFSTFVHFCPRICTILTPRLGFS